MCRVNINHQPDTQQYRHALGSYPTGVAIITTRDKEGRCVGMTINSFCSLSLTPALVSICIDNQSASYHSYYNCRGFTLSFLSADQETIAKQFATRGANKFSELDCSSTQEQFGPAVPGATAVLNCETYQRIPVGDHLMLVGKVHQYQQFDRPALVFEKGRFTSIADDQPVANPSAA